MQKKLNFGFGSLFNLFCQGANCALAEYIVSVHIFIIIVHGQMVNRVLNEGWIYKWNQQFVHKLVRDSFVLPNLFLVLAWVIYISYYLYKWLEKLRTIMSGLIFRKDSFSTRFVD